MNMTAHHDVTPLLLLQKPTSEGIFGNAGYATIPEAWGQLAIFNAVLLYAT